MFCLESNEICLVSLKNNHLRLRIYASFLSHPTLRKKGKEGKGFKYIRFIVFPLKNSLFPKEKNSNPRFKYSVSSDFSKSFFKILF